MDWSAVLYVTGKRNAALIRKTLRTPRVTLLVDARVPLVYSKRVDAVYLSTVRRQLWKATLSPWRPSGHGATHWMQVLEAHEPVSRVRRSAEWQRIWILTDLERGLPTAPKEFVLTLLARIDTEMRDVPHELTNRDRLRLGLYHEDLRSTDVGFESLGVVLTRFFERRGPGDVSSKR